MGYIKHNAIIVTADDSKIEQIHKEAVKICGHLVSGIVKSGMNGYCSFFVAPDGSKEGWLDSAKGDTNRVKLSKKLESLNRKNIWNDHVEVFFGGDDKDIRGVVGRNENT